MSNGPRAGTGDGFLRCSDGRARWGIYGAAGALFVCRRSDEVRVLLQQRSAWSHEGGTWSVPGGALDDGETAREGALREADEEIGPLPQVRVVAEHVFEPATNWKYTTIVVDVDEPFGGARNFETDAVLWALPDEVEALPLHDGFASAWPSLRALIEG